MSPPVASIQKKKPAQGDWVTVEQASMLLGLPRQVIERWCDAGLLRALVLGRQRKIIMSSVAARARKGSLTALHPELAMEWYAEGNGELGPDDVDPDDRRVVWWTCAVCRTQRWRCAVRSRAIKRAACPACAQRPSKLLQDLYPELASEWHPRNNSRLQLGDMTIESVEPVWWQCARNREHVWRAKVRTRIMTPECPECIVGGATRRTAIDLDCTAMELEWHPTKNAGLTPRQLTSTSQVRVWWRCSNDPSHEWVSSPRQRVRFGVGCPYCGGKPGYVKRPPAS